MKNKVGSIVIMLVLYILTTALTLIVSSGISYNTQVLFSFNPFILVLAIIIYMSFVLALYKIALPWLEKIKYIEYLFFVIFVFLAVFCGLYFRLKSNWDMAYVLNVAEKYIKTGEIVDSKYLAYFPNNLMLALVEICVLVVSNFIGFVDNISAVTVANALSISLAVILSYFVAKKMFGRKNALMHLMICILTSPLYLYSAVYYSDTFSLPIGVGILYLWLILKEKDKLVTKILLSVILGILLFVGMKLKILSIFVFIALVVYEFCVGDKKELIKGLCVILPITIISTIMFNSLVANKLLTKEARDKYQIPVEHWILMGLKGNGGWSFLDYANTAKADTYAERKQNVKERIVARIEKRNIGKHLKQRYSKIAFTWHDGTYWVSEKLTRGSINKGRLNQFVVKNGEHVGVYKYITQAMHFSMIIYIIITLANLIITKDYTNKSHILSITIFGLFVFLIMWETRSRFLINILLFMIMLSVNGIEYLNSKLMFKKLKR